MQPYIHRNRQHPAAAPGRSPGLRREPRFGVDVPARPTAAGTQLLLGCLLLAWFMSTGNTPSSMLRPAAFLVGIGVAGSLLLDFRYGLLNMVRADVLMLGGMYVLLFIEFLLPQPDADHLIAVKTLKPALNASLLAIASFAAGRHLVDTGKPAGSRLVLQPVSSNFMFMLFWFCCVAGFAHQWVAVRFNPVTWIDAMMGPRFSQPWSRGQYGKLIDMLAEMGALLYLLPPLGAIIIARPKRYSLPMRLMVGVMIFMVFFVSFTGGTRNQLVINLMMFVIAYGYFAQLKPGKLVLLVAVTCLIFLPLSKMMLTFRDRGFRFYLDMKRAGQVYAWEEKSFFVDYSLLNIGNLMTVIPARQPFLGWKIFYYALIRPIPRAIWQGKPDSGGAEINAALEEEGATLTYSVTFVGEAWSCYGWFSVIGMSMLYGMASSWWNRFGTRRSSDLGITIYASGLLTAAISIRSFNWVVVTMLPTLFLLIIASWFLTEAAPSIVRKLTHRSRPA